MKKVVIFSILFICASITYSQHIKWYTIEQAMELIKKEPRKIVIDVYTTWCGWCKVMDSTTFQNPVIIKYMNEKFYPVKFNAEQKTDVTVNGHVYKFVASGSRGYHELAAALLNGNLGYPSVVFLDEKGNMIQPLQGYYRPVQFDMIIKFIGEDYYKTRKWEEFQTSYVSPIKE
jgi:thioredoxin-related protein